MKTIAGLCNVIWFLFTCLVLATDGLPEKAGFLVASLLVLLVPLLTLLALFRPGAGGAVVKIGAIAGNVALLGFVAGSLLLLPPHPAEAGYVPYLVLTALSPAISLIALLFRGRAGAGVPPTGVQPVG